MEEMQNIFTGKTKEDAIAAGLKALGITEDQAEITVIEEGKKKLFGSVKAKVKIVKKATDGERAAAFIDGLLKILKIPAFNEVVSDGEKIEIEIKTTNTSAVIGRRGEVLDAIQCIVQKGCSRLRKLPRPARRKAQAGCACKGCKGRGEKETHCNGAHEPL